MFKLSQQRHLEKQITQDLTAQYKHFVKKLGNVQLLLKYMHSLFLRQRAEIMKLLIKQVVGGCFLPLANGSAFVSRGATCQKFLIMTSLKWSLVCPEWS